MIAAFDHHDRLVHCPQESGFVDVAAVVVGLATALVLQIVALCGVLATLGRYLVNLSVSNHPCLQCPTRISSWDDHGHDHVVITMTSTGILFEK